jgi:DNA-directed RNA polymerase subunit K/omega
MPHTAPSPFLQYIREHRAVVSCPGTAARTVYKSCLGKESNGYQLARYIADRAPLFYRDPERVIETIKQAFVLTAIEDIVRRLPDSTWFQKSHFAEILAAIFAEEVIGWRKIYSKLTLLTSQNSNAYKIDVLMYVPGTNPLEFIFLEVKSSLKTCSNGDLAKHHRGCFRDLMESVKLYSDVDRDFDLDAAEANLSTLPDTDREVVRLALMPYRPRKITYAGFVVIDDSTINDKEVHYLVETPHTKMFNVDLLSVESLPNVVSNTWAPLDALRRACIPQNEGA